MNKSIKHVTCMVMAIATFSVIQPLNPFNFATTVAYAASYTLTDLQMISTGGSDIHLYENDNYTKELDSGGSLESTYYAKVSSDNSKVEFNTSGASGTVKIFKDGSNKVYEEGTGIPVLSGKTTFYIRVYDNYDDAKRNNYVKQYRVIVKKYSSEEENTIKNDDQGNIYLKTIELDYGDTPLGFNRQKSTYDVKVGADVKSMVIKAEPDDGATTVKINNLTVDENDDYKKTVNLDKGNNKIEIVLSQEYEDKRKYTININRGETTAATTTSTDNTANGTDTSKTQTTNTSENKGNNTNNNENNTTNTGTPNKWVQVLGKWKYNDGYGNLIKNNWYYDSTYGKNYYFNKDGDMVTGWLNLNNTWYYLNSNGAMETGWKQIGSEWYYLNYNGKMQTGWFKDSDDKYYYFYESTGVMAHDTTISGYKLGSNGAWKK